MANNSADLLYDDSTNWKLIWVNMAYGSQGVVIGGSNLFIVFVVLRFTALREAKEYLVMMSLSLADGCNMLAYALGGIRRIYFLATGKDSPMTPWECLTTSHNLIWSFAEHLSGLILLIISIDRLLCVAFPMRYLRWSTKYIVALFGSAYVYTVITGTGMSLVLVHATSYPNILVSPMCYGGVLDRYGVNIYYASYRSYAAVIFAAASIVVYGFTWSLYKKHQNQISPKQTTDTNIKQSLHRQRRLTKSLGISCLCTIFVFMIPYSLGFFLSGKIPVTIVYLFFIFSNFNPLYNVCIYYSRHPEMKQGFSAVFTGKIMPDSLDQWKVNSKEQKNKKSTRYHGDK